MTTQSRLPHDNGLVEIMEKVRYETFICKVVASREGYAKYPNTIGLVLFELVPIMMHLDIRRCALKTNCGILRRNSKQPQRSCHGRL